MNETRLALIQMGEKILNAVRTQLFLSMHFMGPALESLKFIMDLSTTTVGTDSAFIRFNPNYLMETYLARPRKLNRTYMHMLMHCIFRHMFDQEDHEDLVLWNLCCDIAVEAAIDSMEVEILGDLVTDRRNAIYQELKSHVTVLTAQRLYQDFQKRDLTYLELSRLADEFRLDDHSFWEKLRREDRDEQDPKGPDSNMNPEGGGSDDKEQEQEEPGTSKQMDVRSLGLIRMKDEEWKKNARKLKAELELGNLAGTEQGSLSRLLAFTLDKKTDFKEFLNRFLVTREEAGVDLDSFDYGFYNYGMEIYGNMPLIEENEFREANKVENLVIAIDTSASCQRSLVQRFLNETAAMLLTSGSFFHHVNIHILECDDKVQKDVEIASLDQMKSYASGFELKGGFGTDFRPVFQYLEERKHMPGYRNIRGLMYFTDGYGIYPSRPAPYDTAFVFEKDEDYNDTEVPGWAMKLYV